VTATILEMVRRIRRGGNERGRLSTTTTNDRPKRQVTKPDKQNLSPLLAAYASATISKTAALLPPYDDGVNVPPLDDGVNQTKKTSLESITEGHDTVGVAPSEGRLAGSTNTKLTSNVTKTDKFLPPTVHDVMPPVETTIINKKDGDVDKGNLVLDESNVASIANSAVPLDSSSEISDISPVEKANLKIGDDYEKCDPWDKFTSDEIKGQYFTVAVGRNEHSFGIYADLTRFKLEIEGYPTYLYQSCDSYTEAHHYLESYLNNVAHEKVEISTVLSKVSLLRSATTTTRAIQPDGTSYIDNHCQTSILPDTRTDIPKHRLRKTVSPQQTFMAGKTFFSEKLEEYSDDQYTPPDEIDPDIQNSNLLLTSDHDYNDPYERPSWGGMVVYLNTIMKWYGVTPQSNEYFNKSDLSRKKSPPGLYLGNPNKTTMVSITVTRLKFSMNNRNIDVEVVTLPSIMASTEYNKELFFIQGYARRGKKLKKDKNGLPRAIDVESQERIQDR
jgi:hypothetical protein